MLLSAITLETSMTASEVLERLARHGFWVDAKRRESKAWIDRFAKSVHLSFAKAEQRLARNGWRKLAPDTAHPQGDASVREDWKKNSRGSWAKS